MELGTATLLGSIASGLGGLFGNAINANVANQNIEYQKTANAQNIAFQKAENEITRQREDNAITRAALDMQRAGLSKTLAAGSPASASALTAPQTQAVNNSFKYESALEKLNLGNLMLEMASKQKQLEMQKDLNDANIANINADTISKQNVNNTFMRKFLSEEAERDAHTHYLYTQRDLAQSQAELNRIEGDFKADKLRAEINRIVADTKLSEGSLRKLAYDVVYQLSNIEHLNSKTKEILQNIAYRELETKALQYNYDYANEHSLPVGSSGGILGGIVPFAKDITGNYIMPLVNGSKDLISSGVKGIANWFGL